MSPLFGGEIAEQLPDRCILGAQGSPGVEALGLCLHDFSLLAHFVQSQRSRHPDWLARDKSLHILPANERNVITKLRAK
jgi:hypothetical protein